MKCPYCDYVESKVIDSRPTDEYDALLLTKRLKAFP